VLRIEQTEHLKGSIAEYMGLVKEVIEYKIEPEPNPPTSNTANGDPPEAARHSAPVLVLAGRGAVDLAASELIADALRVEHGIGTRCASLGGLTGISAAAEAAPDDPPHVVALISVGAVTRAQLDILVHRLRRSFPPSHIVIGYWGGCKHGWITSDRGEGHPLRPIGLGPRRRCPQRVT
jgi:hypothetical protein